MTTLGFNIKFIADGESDLPEWYFSAVTAFFFLSLAVNALVTGLIVYRIINVYNDIRGFSTNLNNNNSNSGYGGSTTGQRNLYPLISILIESGLITFVAQLAQTIMYKSATVAFPLVGGSVVVRYVRGASFFHVFLGIDDLPFFFSNREFRQQSFLCVSIRASLTKTIHQGLRIRRIQDDQCIFGSSITS